MNCLNCGTDLKLGSVVRTLRTDDFWCKKCGMEQGYRDKVLVKICSRSRHRFLKIPRGCLAVGKERGEK